MHPRVEYAPACGLRVISLRIMPTTLLMLFGLITVDDPKLRRHEEGARGSHLARLLYPTKLIYCSVFGGCPLITR